MTLWDHFCCLGYGIEARWHGPARNGKDEVYCYRCGQNSMLRARWPDEDVHGIINE